MVSTPAPTQPTLQSCPSAYQPPNLALAQALPYLSPRAIFEFPISDTPRVLDNTGPPLPPPGPVWCGVVWLGLLLVRRAPIQLTPEPPTYIPGPSLPPNRGPVL